MNNTVAFVLIVSLSTLTFLLYPFILRARFFAEFTINVGKRTQRASKTLFHSP